VVPDYFDRDTMLQAVAARGARARLEAHSQLAAYVAQGRVWRAEGARAEDMDR